MIPCYSAFIRVCDFFFCARRLKQVEAVVKCKFGVEGLRIFRLLALRGQLEQKQVGALVGGGAGVGGGGQSCCQLAQAALSEQGDRKRWAARTRESKVCAWGRAAKGISGSLYIQFIACISHRYGPPALRTCPIAALGSVNVAVFVNCDCATPELAPAPRC